MMALNVGLEGIRLGPLAICLPHWQSVCPTGNLFAVTKET